MKIKTIFIILGITITACYIIYNLMLELNSQLFGIFGNGAVEISSLKAYEDHLHKSHDLAMSARNPDAPFEESFRAWMQVEFEEHQYRLRYIKAAQKILERLKKYKQVE